MKKLYTLLAVLVATGFFWQANAQNRYLDEVFTSVTVTKDVVYGSNITVITGAPGVDTLLCDVYEPAGDTLAERPVVFVSHTGSFLPVPQNGQTTGNRNDSVVVEMCTLLAKRGYVAVAYTYRLGWNPLGNQDERTGTLLNAAYRGIQDSWNLTRFFRFDYANGNNYGIDTSRMTVGGIGTGGYLSLGTATLDKYSEINLAKFINFNTGSSYVDTSLSGDMYGTWQRPLNLPNYPGEMNKIHMAFNLGGAIGDSTWLEAGDVPMVSFHCPNDPFAPYGYGAVIVPTTGDFVVNVSGSQGVQMRANRLGNNAAFQSGGPFTDPYTVEADTKNDGYDGLFPFIRPTPESGPWDWWDTTAWNIPHPSGGTFNSQGMLTNPDMSAMKARTYIDTVQNYLAPRMVCALNLPGCTLSGLFEELDPGAVSVFPNPTHENFMIRSEIAGNPVERVELVDLQGRLVSSMTAKDYQVKVERNGLPAGLYVVKVKTKDGLVTKKVIFD